MDSVLQGATLLCGLKLICSLLFLPSLTTSSSPISFCCCCLLLFTDFLVTVFLSCFGLYEWWHAEHLSQEEVIVVRFLLFLCHLYGAVLLLTTPLIAVESLVRFLWPSPTDTTQDLSEASEEPVEDGGDKWIPHAVSYLSCLSIWVVAALNVRWQWKLEEVWAHSCLHTTHSLIECLPTILSPMPGAMNPYLSMALLSLLLLLVTSVQVLHRLPSTPSLAPTEHNRWQVFVTSTPPLYKLEPSVEHGTTGSAVSWDCKQLSERHPSESMVFAVEEQGTKGGTPEPAARWSGKHLRGFPCPGVNVITAFVAVISIFVLPLNLSMNIILIRSLETLLQRVVQSVATPLSSSHAPYRLV
ncbi:uncharacterized protein ACB058_005202 isoform 1-T2 [Synchiropus picturatus]